MTDCTAPPHPQDSSDDERKALANAAYGEAQKRYMGPRMHVGTATDREIAAFIQGAHFASDVWRNRHRGPVPPKEISDAERHAGYQQLHELVKDAPEGVRLAVGNDMQRVLANGSYSIHPSMLLSLLTRAYKQGRFRGPVTEDEVEAAGLALYGISWGDEDMCDPDLVRAALEAARAAEEAGR